MNSKLNPSTSNQQAKSPLINSLNNDKQLTPFSLLIAVRSKLSQNHKLRDFTSGLTGGILSTTILHPLDVLKIRLAVNDGISSTKRSYLGLGNAFRTIWVEEGIRGFYRGLLPNSLGAGLSWGLYFLFYNSIRNYQDRDGFQRDLVFYHSMIAAGEAGILTLILTNPIWVIKTRLCLQYGTNLTSKLPPSKQYTGMIDAFSKTFKNEGVKGLYKGFTPGLFNVTHGAIQFSVYEKLKNWHKVKNDFQKDSQIPLEYIFYFSVVSKICAATITYPFQVIRTRLQDQHGHYKNFVDAVVTTYRRESVFGFYKGYLPNVIRVTPATVITMMTYEKMSKLVG